MTDTSKKTLFIMRAPSGSGKSTWIKTHLPSAVVCSADSYFYRSGTYRFVPSHLPKAHAACLASATAAMAEGHATVVIDNTNIRREWYRKYVELARDYGYEVFQVCLTTRFQNVHGVPDDKVQQMHDTFEQDDTIPKWELSQ